MVCVDNELITLIIKAPLLPILKYTLSKCTVVQVARGHVWRRVQILTCMQNCRSLNKPNSVHLNSSIVDLYVVLFGAS